MGWCRSSQLRLRSAAEGPVGFDFYGSDFSGEPVPEAAPWPVFGPLNEAALDWIAVDIAELFDEFGMGEDVEVVVAALPELFAVAFETFGGLCFQGAEDVFEL